MLVNGIEYSWANLELQSTGLVIPGVKSVNYKDSLTPGKVRGSSSVWMGYTDGQYDADGDVEVYRTQHEIWKAALGGPGFYQRKTILTISYFHPELGVVVDTVVARIMGSEAANSDSPDATTIKHPLSVLEPILWNGVPGVLALP